MYIRTVCIRAYKEFWAVRIGVVPANCDQVQGCSCFNHHHEPSDSSMRTKIVTVGQGNSASVQSTQRPAALLRRLIVLDSSALPFARQQPTNVFNNMYQQQQYQQQPMQYAQYYSIDVECVATGTDHNSRAVGQIALVDQYERVRPLTTRTTRETYLLRFKQRWVPLQAA